jgi:transposase
VNFSHEGIEYSADVIRSENLLPPYYWVLFHNPEMQKKLGEDIAFIEKDGKLKSVHPSLSKKNQDLLQAVRMALEKFLYQM